MSAYYVLTDYLRLWQDVDVLRLGPGVQGVHLAADLADILVAHPKQLPPWRAGRQSHLRAYMWYMQTRLLARTLPLSDTHSLT